jgi:hypothetical protein
MLYPSLSPVEARYTSPAGCLSFLSCKIQQAYSTNFCDYPSLFCPPDVVDGNTLLCPYSCLNLGSFALLFKLGQNCICDQDKLNALMRESIEISTVSSLALPQCPS